MADVEVVRDDYSLHNPLDFKSHPKGQKLYWANYRWRSERKGWGQLTPVRQTDSDFAEIKTHMSEAPLDIDIHGDNLVRRGDLVLCKKSQVEVERRQRYIYEKSMRGIERLKKGANPVDAELRSLRDEQVDRDRVQATRPEFSQERPPVIKTGLVRK